MDLEKSPHEQPELPFSDPRDEPTRFAPERFAMYLEELRRCNECRLREGGARLVVGEGAQDGRLVFVGEAPGYEEDRLGRPFVGPSGLLFDRTLAKIGVARGQVFITNVIKYRPPGNRTPRVGEFRACSNHLRREIELLRPKVVGALGAVAARALLGEGIRMKEVRGRRIDALHTAIYPLYHPAFALRNLDRDPQILEIFEADLRRVCREAGLPA